jgi:hypothetical protein
MVRWRRRGSSARYGVGATALTLRRLELAGWSSGGIGLVAARASRARGSEKEVVNEASSRTKISFTPRSCPH